MEFEQIIFLWLLIPVLILWLFIAQYSSQIEDLFSPEILQQISFGVSGFSTKLRLKILLIAISLMIFSLSQPILIGEKIKITKKIGNIVIAIDISKSMLATDIYPNRFEFVKNKLLTSIDEIKNKRLAILGFASQSFLITPLTADKNSIKFLLNNLQIGVTSLSGTNILSILETANEMLDGFDNKQIILLTDGVDGNFEEEINYAKQHKIKIFVYEAATIKGAIIKEDDKVLKDKNGNIVIVKNNPNIINLALKSGGKYLKFSLNNGDLSNLINDIKSEKTTENSHIYQNKQLFIYPLLLSFILLIVAFFSWRKLW